MGYDWENCPPYIKKVVEKLIRESKKIINENFVGFYVHGSLALGGFNPDRSDIDVLVVTNVSMMLHTKKMLAHLFLNDSNSPIPIEISFLSRDQLSVWKHPCPFDFHYSECWRERYKSDLLNGTSKWLNASIHTDPDLAAHITIINDKGICVEGAPIEEVFPMVPRSDYISSIMGDFKGCIQNIEDEPIYGILNGLRVYWYLEEGVISSKSEAGHWGLDVLPQDLRRLVKQAIDVYTGKTGAILFDAKDLISLGTYIEEKIERLLQSNR